MEGLELSWAGTPRVLDPRRGGILAFTASGEGEGERVPERRTIGEAQLAVIEGLLRRASGLSLSPGMRRALPAAVNDAAALMGVSPQALVQRVTAGDDAAVTALVERTVVGETFFWRHPEQIDALRELAFSTEGPLRIWSAGCASGEEPYSIAIALLEAGRAGRGDQIVASDLSTNALARAQQASYGAWALRRMPEELQLRYFAGLPPSARLVPDIRGLVTLVRHNLATEAPPGLEFDVVLCRNVLIYFDAALAAEVLHKLLAATRPGGLVVLGPVELPLAAQVDVEWLDACGASLLRRKAAFPSMGRGR